MNTTKKSHQQNLTTSPLVWERKANSALLLTDKKNKNPAVEDIIFRVRGGSSDWGSVLTEDWSIITYRSWGRSLKYNPVVIDFEVSLVAVEETLRL